MRPQNIKPSTPRNHLYCNCTTHLVLLFMIHFITVIILTYCHRHSFAFSPAASQRLPYSCYSDSLQKSRSSNTHCHSQNNNNHHALRLLPLFSSKGGNDEDANKSSTDEELAFFDEAFIFVRAGSGGQGSSTYKKAKRGDREAKRGADGIPDGGDGGRGGDVVMVADNTLNTLVGNVCYC